MKARRPQSLQDKKGNFLKYLGAKSDEDLYKNLAESFAGDPFEDNIRAIFCNAKREGCEDFYNSLLSWGEEKLDEAFKLRWRVAAANTVGLFAAFGISFASPVAGIAVGVAVSATSGVAEGVAKRNIANFGHLQAHLSNKIHACTTRMIDRALQIDGLTKEAKKSLRKLEHPENKSKKSALARMASYFSGPVASGANNLTSRFANVSTLASGIVGTFIPFLPLITVGLSRLASNIRHKSAISEGSFLDDVAEIIFNQNSWKDKNKAGEELEKLTQAFAKELAASDSHGRTSDEKKYHKAKSGSKDKNTNIKKGITFPAWAAAKIHKIIKRKILRKDVEDIAEMPKGGIVFERNDSADLEESKIDDDVEAAAAQVRLGRFDDIAQSMPSQRTAAKMHKKTASSGYWMSNARGNNFRVLDGIYNNSSLDGLQFNQSETMAITEEDRIKNAMIASIIMAYIGNYVGKAIKPIDPQNILRVMNIAVQQGGVSNQYQYPKVDASVQDKAFSARVQKYNGEMGLYTGRAERENDYLDFPLRSTFSFSDDVRKYFSDKCDAGSIIDIAEIAKAQEYFAKVKKIRDPIFMKAKSTLASRTAV